MSYRVEVNGFVIHAESVAEVLALVSKTPPPPPDWRTLPRKKRAPVAEPAKPVGRPRTFKKPEKLTDEERVALSGKTPALICRKPHGCGKAFQSENRMAWYCPPCTAKRDEGRPV